MSGGWIPLHKGLVRELPHNRPFTRLEAMFSLTLNYDQGNPVTVKGLAATWGWSRGKVDRFFEEVGVSIEYSCNTESRQNQRGQIVIHKTGISQAQNGQIKAIDSRWLQSQASTKRAYDGHKTDRSQSTIKEPNPKPINTFPESLRLSGLLADLILKNNPTHSKLSNGSKESTVNRWAEDIDKLIRIDSQEPKQIEKVIRWCQSNSFWQSNILSGAKLRKQWDALTAKMKADKGQVQPSTTFKTKAEIEAMI